MPKGFSYHHLILKAIRCLPNPRTQEIISQRFGLKDGCFKTLASIGEQYQITRERVRQIEEAAFSFLKKEKIDRLLQPVFQQINRFLNQQGGLVREEKILNDLTGYEKPHPHRGSVLFALTLGETYHRYVHSQYFHPLWTNSKENYQKAEKLISSLVSFFEKRKKTVAFEDILNFVKRQSQRKISQLALASYLDAAKHISQNPFNEFGLIHWPEITPRGMRDKAYLVLQKEGRPLHFTEVARLINEFNFGSRPAHPQTIHNELIRDPRFVLVGRGIYGLAEWGHRVGTVRDVIISLLKEKGPMTKEEIIQEVLKDRLVKESTILINLQNRKYFSRNKSGRYQLNKI